MSAKVYQPTPKPEVPAEIAALIEESGLEWKWVGGQTLGLNPPKYRWQLCAKGSLQDAMQRAKELQRLAAACRLLSSASRLIDDDELKNKILRFLNNER